MKLCEVILKRAFIFLLRKNDDVQKEKRKEVTDVNKRKDDIRSLARAHDLTTLNSARDKKL